MRYLITILFLLFFTDSFSQSKGFMMKGDTLLYVRDIGDTVQITKNISQTGNSGKLLSTNGTTYIWYDIETALATKQNSLGYTPYNSTNPSGYISSITSGNVTTALGFTPYNATNPNSYISSITSGNVTTALGYTPLNPANNLSEVTAATARINLGLSTTANQSSSTNKNFVTDAQLVIIGNTSGSNSGDNAANSTYASDYRAANFVAGAAYLAPSGNGSALTGLTASQVSLGNVNNTSDAAKPVSTATQTALDLKANLASPTFTGTVSGITATMVGLGNVTNESKATMFTSPTFTGSAVLGTPASGNFSSGTFTWPTFNQNTSGSAATLTTARTINGTSFNGSANITIPSDIAPSTSGNVLTSNGTVWTSAARYPQQVATADIVATASATSTTTLYTPTADGIYRVSVYMKITVTGTSPVAGPVTITYTDADGSVAQSHVMLLANTSGAVVTTTVNNTTTTGTVYGSIVMNAKSGVAIQYAIAVSGTFGSGRYTAHLTCERIK